MPRRQRPAMFARLEAALASATQLRLGRRYVPGTLGVLQRWYAAQPSQRIVVALLELDVPMTKTAIEAAVRALCSRHPDTLGVCLARSSARLQTRPLTAADPVPWLESASAGAWSLATALVHEPFAVGAPLFRLALAQDRNTLVCAFDHVALDGISATIFASELARLLDGQTLAAPAPHAALPLDARIDLRPTVRDLAQALTARSPRDLVLTPSNGKAQSAMRTRMLHQRFDREYVASLHDARRSHQVSLHALLAAAALRAAADALGIERGRLRVNSPISLRERCQPPADGLGVFIAGSDSDVELGADLWNIAEQCMRDLARDRPDAPRKRGLLAFAGDLTKLARKYERTAHGRTATLEVSNVGRIDGLPQGARVWLTQGAHYHGPLFMLTVATSDSDGALRCCLSVPDPLVDEQLATRFMRAFAMQLDGARAERSQRELGQQQ